MPALPHQTMPLLSTSASPAFPCHFTSSPAITDPSMPAVPPQSPPCRYPPYPLPQLIGPYLNGPLHACQSSPCHAKPCHVPPFLSCHCNPYPTQTLAANLHPPFRACQYGPFQSCPVPTFLSVPAFPYQS